MYLIKLQYDTYRFSFSSHIKFFKKTGPWLLSIHKFKRLCFENECYKAIAKKCIICEFKIHKILRGCEGTHSLTVLISISSLFRIVRNEKDIMVIELCQYLQQRRSPSWFHRYFCVRDFNPIWWHCPLSRSKLPFLCETIL